MTARESSLPLRWWQCDRKTLAVAGLFIGSSVGWIAMRFAATYEERRAVAELEGLEARVYYDFQWDEHDRFTQPVGPTGLRRMFGHARAGNGHSCAIIDAQLVLLNALPRLEILDLTNTKISGLGFKDVKQAEYLKGLYLARTQVNDEALKEVTRFASLKNVIFSDTEVSDAGIVHLEKLANPESLRLDGTRCSSEGLERLRKKFPKCQVVP